MSDPFPRDATPAGDLALVRAVRSGDPDALVALAERLRCVPRFVAALNRRRGGILSREDVEDLGQDTLVIIWRKLDTFFGQSTLEMWASRISFLEFMNRLRAAGRAAQGRTTVDVAEVEPQATEEPEPHLLEHVERLMDELEPTLADVVRLKHFGQKTFGEISLQLGIPTNTAKTRYYRGIALLQERARPHTREEIR